MREKHAARPREQAPRSLSDVERVAAQSHPASSPRRAIVGRSHYTRVIDRCCAGRPAACDRGVGRCAGASAAVARRSSAIFGQSAAPPRAPHVPVWRGGARSRPGATGLRRCVDGTTVRASCPAPSIAIQPRSVPRVAGDARQSVAGVSSGARLRPREASTEGCNVRPVA